VRSTLKKIRRENVNLFDSGWSTLVKLFEKFNKSSVYLNYLEFLAYVGYY
jgi:hypothetical protein